jgi:hypothetical protein
MNLKSIAEASIDSLSLGGRELEGGGFYTELCGNYRLSIDKARL